VVSQISKIKTWQKIGNGHFAANMRFQIEGWSHPRRMAVIERNLPAKKNSEQLALFEMMESRYEVVVTNLNLNSENVWRLYNRCTMVGQVIDELKNDSSPRAFGPKASG
jgi:hypothetical protein